MQTHHRKAHKVAPLGDRDSTAPIQRGAAFVEGLDTRSYWTFTIEQFSFTRLNQSLCFFLGKSRSEIMKPSKLRLLLAVTAAAAVVLIATQITATSGPAIANRVLARQLNIELGKAQKHPYEQRLSSGAMYALLEATGQLQQRAAAQGNSGNHADNSRISHLGTQGCANTFSGGAVVNIRVNQDCSLRRQAEEVVLVNPTDPLNLIAGPERLADRLQPLRVRLVVRRRQDLGRPAATVLAVRPGRWSHRGCLQ